MHSYILAVVIPVSVLAGVVVIGIIVLVILVLNKKR